MASQHNISIKENSLVIDNAYFRLKEIRFVDVVKQEASVMRKLSLTSAIFSGIFMLMAFGGSAEVAAFFFICLAVSLTIFFANKIQYALRIGQNMGTTKVLVSPDFQELENVRREIDKAMASHNEASEEKEKLHTDVLKALSQITADYKELKESVELSKGHLASKAEQTKE